MQFNIIFKTIFEYIHKKFRFVHTNTFCKYRKKLRASPRVHRSCFLKCPVTNFVKGLASVKECYVNRSGSTFEIIDKFCKSINTAISGM